MALHAPFCGWSWRFLALPSGWWKRGVVQLVVEAVGGRLGQGGIGWSEEVADDRADGVVEEVAEREELKWREKDGEGRKKRENKGKREKEKEK